MLNRLFAFRKWLLGDPRHFQILALLSFLTYGLVDLGWDAQISAYLIMLSAGLLTQAIGMAVFKVPMSSVKSALITILGLCLLLKANSILVYGLGATFAIASKFLIRVDKAHVFNPANFGIIAVIVFTGDAWISPGQWGSGPMLLFFFGAAAAMVLLRCGRIDTSLYFLGTLVVLEFARSILFLGWTLDVPLHRLSNGALLLFTFFMITDPMTTPRHRKGRVVWSVLLALITFGVGQFYYVHTAPLWTLFFISPLTVILNKVWRASRFTWAAPLSHTQSTTT